MGTGALLAGTGALEVVGGAASVPETGPIGVGVAAVGTAQSLIGGVMIGGAVANIQRLVNAPIQSSVHGNTAGNQPAEKYKKYDKNGKFLKHGVSQKASTRYTKKQLNGGRVVVMERGPRSKLLRSERKLIERDPGPENHEPWAGAKQK